MTLNCSWHRVSSLSEADWACTEQPIEYWYSYTALTCGIIHCSLALQCLICKELRWGHFFYCHHLLCISADFSDSRNPLSLCLLLCFLSTLQIYGFESGTMGAVTIALTPHSFCCWRASRLVRNGTLAKVFWLAICHRVNWKVNIKLGIKWGQ